jgi:hypothetical protein
MIWIDGDIRLSGLETIYPPLYYITYHRNRITSSAVCNARSTCFASCMQYAPFCRSLLVAIPVKLPVCQSEVEPRVTGSESESKYVVWPWRGHYHAFFLRSLSCTGYGPLPK